MISLRGIYWEADVKKDAKDVIQQVAIVTVLSEENRKATSLNKIVAGGLHGFVLLQWSCVVHFTKY